MTAKAAKPAKRVAAVKKSAPARKVQARKGIQPAKKAAKRASTRAKKAPAGAKPSSGAQLRADLPRKGDGVGITLLIRQAARVADRLDDIDSILSGNTDAWLKLKLPRSDAKRGRIWVEVKIDALLIEERNQSTLLRHLLREIDRQRGDDPDDPDEDDDLDID